MYCYENGVWTGSGFYGVEIPKQDKENGYISYLTLSKAFSHILCNEIVAAHGEEMEPVNGSEYDEETDTYKEVFQWYLIDECGKSILETVTNEIVYYIPSLDLYVWGVTHWGTYWGGVSTDIKLS